MLGALMDVRHSGTDPPVIYYDDFSLTCISRASGYLRSTTPVRSVTHR